MRSVISGATGFIGRRLVERLDAPTVLSRKRSSAEAALAGLDVESYSEWTPTSGPVPVDAISGRDVVFHLAGEPVAEHRWNSRVKKRIRESRVEGTRNLVLGIEALPESDRPRVLVCASAIGWYGERGDEVLDESAPPVDDFLGETCQQWENEAVGAERLGLRVVRMRIGLVVGSGGGLIAEVAPIFRKGLGGRIGSGQQWMSWIHVDDIARAFVFVAENENASGAINATSPNPCRNSEFTEALGKALGRPTLLPVPRIALRLKFGEFADSMVASTRVVPKALQELGFEFDHPDLDGAIEAALR